VARINALQENTNSTKIGGRFHLYSIVMLVTRNYATHHPTLKFYKTLVLRAESYIGSYNP
jgi:hypothetical protein